MRRFYLQLQGTYTHVHASGKLAGRSCTAAVRFLGFALPPMNNKGVARRPMPAESLPVSVALPCEEDSKSRALSANGPTIRVDDDDLQATRQQMSHVPRSLHECEVAATRRESEERGSRASLEARHCYETAESLSPSSSDASASAAPLDDAVLPGVVFRQMSGGARHSQISSTSCAAFRARKSKLLLTHYEDESRAGVLLLRPWAATGVDMLCALYLIWQLVFYFETLLTLCAANLGVFICHLYDVAINVSWSVVSLMLIFPLSSSISMAFARRERCICLLGSFRTVLVLLYAAHTRWGWRLENGRWCPRSDHEHGERLLVLSADLLNELERLLLLNRSERLATFWSKKRREKHRMVQKHREGRRKVLALLLRLQGERLNKRG